MAVHTLEALGAQAVITAHGTQITSLNKVDVTRANDFTANPANLILLNFLILGTSGAKGRAIIEWIDKDDVVFQNQTIVLASGVSLLGAFMKVDVGAAAILTANTILGDQAKFLTGKLKLDIKGAIDGLTVNCNVNHVGVGFDNVLFLGTRGNGSLEIELPITYVES